MSWEVRTMRSGTSFFNAALFRKTFLRFWPIWALYTAGWTLVLPLRLWADAMRRSAWTAPELSEHLQNAVNGIPGLLEPGVPLAAGAGLVCAMAVFSYLYSSRSACMMHALPLRREALFLTQYLAGLWGLKPYPAEKLMGAARRFTLPWCRRAVVRCGEVDLAMKSTGQDGQQLLTGLLLELAAPASRPAPQRR